MVYRGKPSAGCENCRKAKKRCGLEQPACLRCVKLKKTCTGYRDTSQLQIQDESEAVRQKAERQRAKNASSRPESLLLTPGSSTFTSQPVPMGILTPFSIDSDPSSGTDSINDIDEYDEAQMEFAVSDLDEPAHGQAPAGGSLIILPDFIRPKPQDVASNYFFYQFTAPGQWEYIRDIAMRPKLDPCLEFAIRACGMAAMTNVEFVPSGKAYAQSNYVEALGLLNQALRDPVRSRSDEALIAVSMLGYYENVSCDGQQSIRSWKAHTAGATQMLKLRGKSQFETPIGRVLFREIRAQIMIAAIWDDQEVPAFLEEYQEALSAETTTDFHGLWKMIDDLTDAFCRFAKMRKRLLSGKMSPQRGLEETATLERDLIHWSADVVETSDLWQYYEMDVDESEHVWDGKVHAYAGNPAPTIWNQWRLLRIMLSRSQEMISRQLAASEEAPLEQRAYFRRVRRQMTDEICKTIPVCLGHAKPAFSSSCVLVSAYSSIWALFFAGTYLVERVGPDAQSILYDLPERPKKPPSAAYAQAAWVMGRLRYIAEDVGLKWADGIAAVLRGEVNLHPRPSVANE